MEKWNTTKHNFLIELRNSGNYTWKEIADEMTDKYDHIYTGEQCRSRWRTNRHKVDESDPVAEYGMKTQKNKDGTIDTDRLIAINKAQLKDDHYILDAHGYDDSWEIISHQFSMWNHHNKQDGTKTLYASKLRVKPKESKISTDDLIEIITDQVNPVEVKSGLVNPDNKALGVYYTDLHFGPNTLEDYEGVLNNTLEIINSKEWDEIIIPFGSDLLHVDNLNQTTANQTRVQDVDIPKMIEDAKRFYVTIINESIKQSEKVTILYISGNHDLSTSYLLSHWLEGYYKEVDKVTVCKEIEEIKVHMYGKVFMAFTHGDKGGKRKVDTLPSQYPVEWAKANVREMYTGHLHHEQTEDKNGITFRILPTKSRTDEWHKKNSYVGSHKRFALFEYTKDKVNSIHYV